MRTRKSILGFLVVAAACCLRVVGAVPRVDHRLPAVNPESIRYSLIFHVGLLRELDSGNLKNARSMLEDECMADLVGLLELSGFKTNEASLLTNSGLRAAARYWSGRKLPIADDGLRSDVESLLANVRGHVRNRGTP